MAATNAVRIFRPTTTVSTAIIRFVREPAISQLSTSAPTPSVPNGCAADGRGPCVESVGLEQRIRRPYERNQRNQHPRPSTISAYLPLALRQMRKHGFHGGSGCHVGRRSHGSRRSLRGRRRLRGWCGFRCVHASTSCNVVGMFQSRVERMMRHIDRQTQQQEERGQQEQFALHRDQIAVAHIGDEHRRQAPAGRTGSRPPSRPLSFGRRSVR